MLVLIKNEKFCLINLQVQPFLKKAFFSTVYKTEPDLLAIVKKIYLNKSSKVLKVLSWFGMLLVPEMHFKKKVVLNFEEYL